MGVAPSGVNALPESQQALVVLTIFALVAAGTVILLRFYGLLGSVFGRQDWYMTFNKFIIGSVFLAAGIAHFTAAAAFESIYPPPGTWGFWYLPGSAEFHVAWTGVAEIAGGAGLGIGALALAAAAAWEWEVPPLLRQLHSFSALGLFALVLVVSPANIYMYTHGAQMVGLTPGDAPIPVEGHYARAFLQSVLLSILWSSYQDIRGEVEARSA